MQNQIRVLVRCRPLLEHESNHGTESICVESDSSTIRLETRNKATKEFSFDKVFDGSTSQQCVYEQGEFSQTVDAVLRGYNATVFAYGQTGTGKTHTMEGRESRDGAAASANGDASTSDVGIVPRIARELFEVAKRKHGDGLRFSCSFVQIYMEQVYDLLHHSVKKAASSARPASARPASSRGKPSLQNRLKLRWSKEREFYLDNVRTFDCEDPKEIIRRFHQGVGNRKVASHRLNIQSSRSHSIFMINACKPGEGVHARSVLMLVDLAGSERASHTGSHSRNDLLRESVFINKSLFTLRKVISSLADRRKKIHIPFRDSTLTSILKNSIGGNAMTTMIACLTPSDAFYDENLSTLEYASRASSIVNQVVINEDPKTKLIRTLKKRVRELESELQRYKCGLGGSIAPGATLGTHALPAVAAVDTNGSAHAHLHPTNINTNTSTVRGGGASSGASGSGSPDYEEIAVDTQNANEALMLENADLREQLRFIQAIVTMEDDGGGLGGGLGGGEEGLGSMVGMGRACDIIWGDEIQVPNYREKMDGNASLALRTAEGEDGVARIRGFPDGAEGVTDLLYDSMFESISNDTMIITALQHERRGEYMQSIALALDNIGQRVRVPLSDDLVMVMEGGLANYSSKNCTGCACESDLPSASQPFLEWSIKKLSEIDVGV